MIRNFPSTYLSLCQYFGLDRGIPWTRDWTAAADFLELLVEEMARLRPAVILECGSGLSTLMLARCCQQEGKGHVWSLENGPEYAVTTGEALAAYSLEPFATVVHAPLLEVEAGGESWPWYDCSVLPEEPVELLVIDGPPGFLREQARYPALPLLAPRLAPGCLILLDDAARPDERAVVARWLKEFPGMGYRYLDLERGCAVLEWC